MHVYSAVVLTIFILLAGWMILSITRSNRVYRFNKAMLKVVSTQSKNDIKNVQPFRWRYDELAKFPFRKACNKFWIPLKPEHWFENTDFLYKDSSPSESPDYYLMLESMAIPKATLDFRDLSKQLPGMDAIVKHPVFGTMLPLRIIIIGLNDRHRWTRDQIADWLETLDVDLEFKPLDTTERT